MTTNLAILKQRNVPKLKFCYAYPLKICTGIFEAGDWGVGGRAESLHIMSWMTRSNSDRQEKGNGQDRCANAGQMRGTERKGVVQQEARREDSSQEKRKGQWQ